MYRGSKIMKIAVTCLDGNVHPHFGQCTCVKFYEVEDNKVVSTDVVEMAAPGHSLIARVLFGNAATTLITGSLKPGAAAALEMSNIQLVAGATGPADAAVDAFLAGTLQHDPAAITTETTCGHDD